MKDDERMKQDDLSQMSQLLLSGATMLSDSCPDCKIPLFKKKENIFCPNCGRKAVYIDTDDEAKHIEQELSLTQSIHQLKDVLTGKINYLTNQLASTNEPKEVKDILELLDKITIILQNLNT
ncbi:MAG: Sjogren's syndrome/scleroderma autoantigen 1 family protein [Candidatus Hodarchaeales archaeon]|jgi:UPF0148 protein